MSDPLVEAIKVDVRYARDRLQRAREAYRRSPVEPRVMRWLDNAEADYELWLERLEKAQGGHGRSSLAGGRPAR